jgi:NADPH2:quinone reductase
MQSYAMLIERTGGPDVIRRSEIELAAPGPDEALIKHTAIGLNFVDIYYRSGQFVGRDALPLPAILGVQAAGIVEQVGARVDTLRIGDRVGYVGTPGACADRRLIPARKLIKLPDDITDECAAAAMVRGLAAEYLLRRLYKVQPGETILIHAVTGGVGLILCQWAKALGATVIGTVSSDDKAALAAGYGCDHAVVHTGDGWVERVLEITGGHGVAVVYDSIGKATFMDSLRCLRGRGTAINFGTVSGQVENFALQSLLHKSLTVCRPTLLSFVEDRDEYEAAAAEFFEVVRRGIVRIPNARRYDLEAAAQAHADFEQRRMSAMPVLIPRSA